jgi:nucleotide-binding universal stress UspA family protein
MPFPTILSVLDLDQENRDLQIAVALAIEAKSHLSVLVVGLASPPPIGSYAAIVSDPWMEERQEDVNRLLHRVEETKLFLKGAALSAEVSSAYVEVVWASEVIARYARYTDLAVIGPDLLKGELARPALNGTLFESARPVLVIPENSRSTLRPKTILLAWDSRQEAARAAREALEVMKTAEDVHVTLVDPDAAPEANGAEPGADVALYLARHGVKVKVDQLPSAGRTVSAALQRHALDIGADMIVMGAYGHSRMRERIFGGVTRTMIEEAKVPLFMAH